jgi:hypothetical protein
MNLNFTQPGTDGPASVHEEATLPGAGIIQHDNLKFKGRAIRKFSTIASRCSVRSTATLVGMAILGGTGRQIVLEFLRTQEAAAVTVLTNSMLTILAVGAFTAILAVLIERRPQP